MAAKMLQYQAASYFTQKSKFLFMEYSNMYLCGIHVSNFNVHYFVLSYIYF